MGAVYQAQDRLRNRDVAIKVMLPSVLSLPKAVVRFQNEAELMMGLTHDGVVNVHDVGLDPTTGIRFFTMELLRGQSLRAWLEAKKDAQEKVSLEDALEIARQLCEALRYAHRKTVHRDLKPENIFLVEGEKIHVKVLDFGIAKVQSQSAFTRTNVSLGTVDYMAPEQRQDAASVDERADIYSVCVILYEMLTGVLPIGRYPTPAEERPGLPRAIDEVVLTGLDRRPERRHPTAESLLAQVLAVGKRARGGGSRRSRKGLAIVGVLLLLGLGAAGAWRAGLFSGWTSTEPGGGAGSVVPLSFAELEPANGASLVLDAATLTIKGRLSDPSAGPIWVGEPGKTGIEKGVDKEGRFTAHPGLDPAATTIEIRAGQPPRQITARVAVTIDTAPPVVTFVDPPEWAGGPLQVAVKVDDANPRRVHFRLEAGGRTVGTPVEAAVPASGLAKATLSVPAGVTGLAVIAEAEDVVGRKGHARSVVAFDRTPPRIQILGPADGLVTKARFVKVSARIEGSRGSVQARVVAPGAVLPVRESALVEGMLGPLRLSLPRDDGSATIVVEARDGVGNLARATVKVIVDRSRPLLLVEVPVEPIPHDVEEAEVTIRPMEPLASLVVDHEELIRGGPASGPFTVRVPVEEGGKATLIVVAKDVAGNEATEIASVVRLLRPEPAEEEPAGKTLTADMLVGSVWEEVLTEGDQGKKFWIRLRDDGTFDYNDQSVTSAPKEWSRDGVRNQWRVEGEALKFTWSDNYSEWSFDVAGKAIGEQIPGTFKVTESGSTGNLMIVRRR
jgi:hypothetical protein